MLKALKLNSEEARLRFPRLLQIIELYPAETLDLMAKEVGSLPGSGSIPFSSKYYSFV
jgi:DNA-dependent protein kinase catalytic subunit